MKKIFKFILLLLFFVVIFIMLFSNKNDGSTTEKRELMLNESISKGSGWQIATETEIDGYVVSGAYSTDNLSSIAVFEPDKNNGFKFMTSRNCHNDEIIIDTAVINKTAYNLIWFNGAKTEYAEVTYTVDNKPLDTLTFDTSDMDIICCKAPSDDYTVKVVYYGADGTKYE